MLQMVESLITDKMGPLGPVILLVLLGVVLLVVALPQMVTHKPDPLDRAPPQGPQARRKR